MKMKFKCAYCGCEMNIRGEMIEKKYPGYLNVTPFVGICKQCLQKRDDASEFVEESLDDLEKTAAADIYGNPNTSARFEFATRERNTSRLELFPLDGHTAIFEPGDSTRYCMLYGITPGTMNGEMFIGVYELNGKSALFTYAINAIRGAWSVMEGKTHTEQLINNFVVESVARYLWGRPSDIWTARAIVEGAARWLKYTKEGDI